MVITLTSGTAVLTSGGRSCRPDPLTDRERQVLRMAGDGQTSADIASSLRLSEGTVRNYLSEAISKLGAANRVEAARIAREKGWL